MKKLIIMAIAMISISASAITPDQVDCYLRVNGKTLKMEARAGRVELFDGGSGIVIRKWTVPGVAKPGDEDLQPEAESRVLMQLPEKDLKIQSGKLVEKTHAEKETEGLVKNGGIYAYQNAFLLLCDQVSGTNTHEKLAFETLPPLLKVIKKGGNKAKFEDLRDAFNTINQALIKKAGIEWWDTCVWNTNAVVVAGGQAIYSGLMD